ncbi:tyrosine--tRNA ligase, mitochondrial-like, partial [Diaphorina citri]|uniref:tyrosine--tRNA ligase n=1 Tax=Diaphorina citri TaxID=121845 RepID=A0A1S3DC06_DIACI
ATLGDFSDEIGMTRTEGLIGPLRFEDIKLTYSPVTVDQKKLDILVHQKPEERRAQKKLAEDLTLLVHGVSGLTTPIIESESGEKFGKSARNAIWLDSKLSSSFELYQYLIRTKDSEVYDLLKLFSFDSLAAIEDFKRQNEHKPEERRAQKKLAEDLTLLVHGEEGLKSAKLATQALYSQDLDSLGSLNATDASRIFPGARIVELLMEPGMSMLELSLATKCFPRDKEANLTISEGGFYVNYKKVQNPQEVLSPSAHILPNSLTLLRVGTYKNTREKRLTGSTPTRDVFLNR